MVLPAPAPTRGPARAEGHHAPVRSAVSPEAARLAPLPPLKVSMHRTIRSRERLDGQRRSDRQRHGRKLSSGTPSIQRISPIRPGPNTGTPGAAVPALCIEIPCASHYDPHPGGPLWVSSWWSPTWADRQRPVASQTTPDAPSSWPTKNVNARAKAPPTTTRSRPASSNPHQSGRPGPRSLQEPQGPQQT
jgi:hypothetical protein